MRFMLKYLNYVVNAIFAPKEYFQYLRDQDITIRKGAIVAITSSIFYGLFAAVRSVLTVSFGEVTMGLAGMELLTMILQNILNGFATLLISTGVSFLIIHAMVKILGSSGWKNTFNAVTYATPVIFLTGAVMIVYQLFETFLMGFPLVNYLGLGIALFYTAYVQARGLEALQTMSFRRALVATITPAVISVILYITAFLMVMAAMTSMLASM